MKRVYSVIKALLCCGCQIPFHSFINKNNRRVVLAFIIGGLLSGAANSSQAQTANTKQTATMQSAQPGTYQFILNSRKGEVNVSLTPYELERIEQLRKDNEVVCAQATNRDGVRVKILPRNVINAPGFKPVPLYYYKDEEKYEEFHNFRYVDLE